MSTRTWVNCEEADRRRLCLLVRSRSRNIAAMGFDFLM